MTLSKDDLDTLLFKLRTKNHLPVNTNDVLEHLEDYYRLIDKNKLLLEIIREAMPCVEADSESRRQLGNLTHAELLEKMRKVCE